MNKASHDLGSDAPWSEGIMGLSALLAMMTLSLIWRLSWHTQERPLPSVIDPPRDLPTPPRESGPHSRAPAAGAGTHPIRHPAERPRP